MKRIMMQAAVVIAIIFVVAAYCAFLLFAPTAIVGGAVAAVFLCFLWLFAGHLLEKWKP